MPSSTAIIGIDPGKAGGLSLITEHDVFAVKMPETEQDIWNQLRELRDMATDVFAVIEKVGPNRGPEGRRQGASSMFTFGRGVGGLTMALVGLAIPFDEVTPQKWQLAMQCRSGGDKNVTKRRAQQLFPHLKITHAIADALLIAEYARRRSGGLVVESLAQQNAAARR